MPSKSHALGRTNHQRWLRLRGIGQRSDLSELAVLAAQFFNRTELNGALRTGLHADGLQTGFETVKTAVALAHLLGDRIENRCMVRASHGASAAADALFGVNYNQTIFLALEVSLGGAHLHASRIGTMVARNRNVVGANVLMPSPRSAVLLPGAGFGFKNFAEIAADFQIVCILAGDRAGLAAGALGEINEKSKLCHVCAPGLGLADFHKVGMLRIALGKRTRAMARERIDARTHVDRLAVFLDGLVPGALRHGTYAGHDALGDMGGHFDAAAVVKDMHLVAIGNVEDLGVKFVDQHLIRMDFAQPRQIVEGRVRTAVTVVPEALQRIFLGGLVAGHIKGLHKLGQSGDNVALGKHPGLRKVGQSFGINFDLSGRRLERILHRVVTEFFEHDRLPLHIEELRGTGLPELVEFGQFGIVLAGLFIAPLDPTLLIASFRVLFFQTEFLGDATADFPARTLIESRINRLVHRINAGKIAHRVTVATDVVRFGTKRIGQKDVGIACRRRHHVVAHHDEFALAVVAQHLVRPVAIAVLVDEGVTARINDHLDAVTKLLALFETLDAVVDPVHLFAAQNGIGQRNTGI